MDLYSKTPKERMAAYGTSSPNTEASGSAAPSTYLKDFMDFMAGIAQTPGDRIEEAEEEAPEPTTSKVSSGKVSSVKGLSGDKKEFMSQYAPLISKAANALGLAKDMVLAQIALETGWGVHTPGHNIGGIKADSRWKGKTQDLMTSEYSPEKGNYRVMQTFRAYDTPEEGVKDYFSFLSKNGRYKPLFGVQDPYKAADIMAKSGYATSQTYKPQLYSMIKQIQAMQA